jgi:hypothetical protein
MPVRYPWQGYLRLDKPATALVDRTALGPNLASGKPEKYLDGLNATYVA